VLANHPENLSKESRKWLDHIKACEAAGQTMVEYARARGLNLKGFYNGCSFTFFMLMLNKQRDASFLCL